MTAAPRNVPATPPERRPFRPEAGLVTAAPEPFYDTGAAGRRTKRAISAATAS
ncbi:MAG: hypothetical protein Kow00122_04490 [Thermoleophilia bacterium]